MKATCIGLISCLSAVACFSQTENSKLQAGIYSGINLTKFVNSRDYPTSPLPGWKAGLLIGYDLSQKFRLSGQIGATFDKCDANDHTVSPMDIQWEFVWADVTPLISYLPIQGKNFQLTAGTGISVRKSLGATVGHPSNGREISNGIFQWTYFLPVQLSGVLNLAKGSRLILSAEYSIQLRRIYYPAIDYDEFSNWTNRLQSWSLVLSYSLPLRHRSA